ncbi:hypothetical protein CTI12_AA461240 [Artemisia annua]|uniref:Uncharacterized protein n=1 Tax=Artemisia annua TaxID=35608 RepID=A0A2U1LSA3_ARTAN|nr:hypothetical protein CTI12_AA461240 [Artemisia annua]
MDDSNWQEVNRGKRRSVFQRLNPSQSQKSNMDDLAKISLSVYVSNFPSHLTVRELWNICGKVGTLVDVFIAKRKNKYGQMFAFCRYLKVPNPDVLIGSLCKIWIGKLRLYANVARFGRNEVTKPSNAGVKVVNSVSNNDRFASSNNKSSSYVNVAKASLGEGKISPNTDEDDVGKVTPALELNQADSIDFPLAILGCYKDFRSIANARILCHTEGFLEVDVKYLGGLWVMFEFKSLETRDKFLKHEGVLSWFSSLKPWHDDFVVEERLVWLEIEGVPLRAWENDTFISICRKWGDVLFSDDSDSSNRLSKRICIKSTHSQLIFATILVSLKKITYAIRIRELCSWTPTFVGDDLDGDDEEEEDAAKAELDPHNVDGDIKDQFHDVASCNSDPFGLDPLINKKVNKDFDMKCSETPVYPPGFSPASSHNQNDGSHDHNPVLSVGSESSHKVFGDSQIPVGFSLLERLEETIKFMMGITREKGRKGGKLENDLGLKSGCVVEGLMIGADGLHIQVMSDNNSPRSHLVRKLVRFRLRLMLLILMGSPNVGGNNPNVSALKRTYDHESFVEKIDSLAGNKSFATDIPKVVLFDDLKVLKGVEELVPNEQVIDACKSFENAMRGANDISSNVGIMPTNEIPRSFASLVNNEAINDKVNFRALDMDTSINAKADV